MTRIEGPGLHTGAHGAVTFKRREGPAALCIGGVEASISELRVEGSLRSTSVTHPRGGGRFATTEHLFAALGGMGIHAGVAVVVEGDEAPLADGGARLYARALRELGVAPSAPPLRVVTGGALDVGASRYELEPGASVELEVLVDFDDARLATRASWRGGVEDFYERIAAARTFGFEHEIDELLARGLASHVTPTSVVVVGKDRVFSAGAAFAADEPVRHKLLDLIGDLYLYGGPPRGLVRASRPGHAATHEAMRRALAEGLVVRDGPESRL